MVPIAKYAEQCENIKVKAEQVIKEAGFPFHIQHDKEQPIRLVFAGQYSSGKSSIIKMLTGDESIVIGAGITTQKTHIYNWHGIEIVDTPGIHTERNPDHDITSYSAIAEADALVFVITNELFDAHIASHFKKLAIDHEKGAEMILVVNKMDRTTEGNTDQQQSIIREALGSILAPYTPEQMRICFIDTNAFFESVEEVEEDSDYAQELRDNSGYDFLVSTLDAFLTEKGSDVKLTTELYLVQEQLQATLTKLSQASNDNNIKALEEHYRQQRHAFSTARTRVYDSIQAIFSIAASTIREIGRNAADMLSEGCSEDEVNEALRQAMSNANTLIDKTQIQAMQVLEDELNQTGQTIDQLERNDFSAKLRVNLISDFDALPDPVKRLIGQTFDGVKIAGKKALEQAYKPGVAGGLKLSNFSGSNVHEWVKKAGSFVGYKFKPWQAVKLTKGIAIGGQILGAAGAVVSVYTQIKNDIDEDKARQALLDDRRNVRKTFIDAAAGLEEYGHDFLQINGLQVIDHAISEIDEGLSLIRSSQANQSTIYRKVERLSMECQRLITTIHIESGN